MKKSLLLALLLFLPFQAHAVVPEQSRGNPSLAQASNANPPQRVHRYKGKRQVQIRKSGRTRQNSGRSAP